MLLRTRRTHSTFALDIRTRSDLFRAFCFALSFSLDDATNSTAFALDTMPPAQDPIPAHPAYHAYLVELMGFIDDDTYHRDQLFTPVDLIHITPVQVKRWMCKKVYGSPDPAPTDRPVYGRSSSLEFYKKAISHYMPLRLQPWNPIRSEGNPTRSVEVNDLIKKVKKAEVRKQGKPSSARRPLEMGEYRALLRILENFADDDRKYAVPATLKFQYNMIARIDDTANFECDDLMENAEFPFALLCKMCWSKNVMEESDAPDQILLGAMDPDFCILLVLAIFLEHWIENGDGLHSKYVFTGDLDDGAPKRCKDHVRSVVASIYKSAAFQHARVGPLGTHSARKFPSTYARRNGCSRDDVDCRGRWKRRQRVSDRYIDPRQPYYDAKVAAALCVGGPIKYVLRQGSGVTDNWLAQHVVPHILLKWPRAESRVGLTLALPLLWACMDATVSAYLPAALKQRVRNAYSNVRQLAEGVNPVQKQPILVYRVEDQLMIDEQENVQQQAQGGQQQQQQQHGRTSGGQGLARHFNGADECPTSGYNSV